MIKRLLFLMSLCLLANASLAQVYVIGNSSVNTCSGTFYDSGNNGGGYGNNESYTMTFCASTSGQCIRVAFTMFDTESGYDELEIFDGPNTGSTLLGVYSGTTLPGTITSTSGCLTFRFTSDWLFAYDGWAATLSCVNCANGNCLQTCNGGAAPANDECANATNIGLLPAPAPCPGGTGGVVNINGTNLCATAENPYTYLTGCTPAGNMASPAASVWYRFDITAPLLNISISGGVNQPNLGLYNGTNCANLIARGCAIGANGLLNTSFNGLAAGTYYLQISGGSLTDQCDFTLTLQNNFDCQGCVIQSGLTVNPPPVNGAYMAGQNVTFCYTVNDYNQTSANWLHGVVPTFGAGWNPATLVPVMPTNCSGAGTWQWINGNVTSTATGLVTGSGFYYDSPLGDLSGGYPDNNPGDNYGDNNAANTCDWTFCWSISTDPPAQCVQGASLNITIDTYGDGETGSWTSVACTQDPLTYFAAQLNCCTPPTVNVVNAGCAGASGSATGVGQGAGPWDYTWQNNTGVVLQTNININGTNTVNGLAPGNYVLLVTDANGCTSNAAFTIGSSAALNANISTSTNVSCFNGSNGAATVAVVGGTAPLSYSWSPSGGSAATASNLVAGNYTVTVTDGNGCVTNAVVNILQPTALALNAAAVPANCNGTATGSALVNANGGTGPYAYAWSPSGGSGSAAINLVAGNYTVTVTDSRGCVEQVAVSVSQPPPMIANITNTTNVLCNGTATGSITAAAAGGTGPYSYQWTPSGGSTATANGLIAGNYSITITDANGCTANAGANVAQPLALTYVYGTTAATCGQANGSGFIIVNGGNGVYNYTWSPTGGNAASANNLAAGGYTIQVTDGNGCVMNAALAIGNGAGPAASLSSSNDVSCFGGSNGSASVSVVGGSGPYSYAWSPSGGNAANASGLSAGNYSVAVTDVNGCVSVVNLTINEPAAINLNINANDVICNGGNSGSATVVAIGGSGPYTYTWLPVGGNGAAANLLNSGNYTVSVTDALGCTALANVVINEPAPLALNVSAITNATCFGMGNASASVLGSGGTGVLNYNWMPGNINGASINNLYAGNYSVTLTDASGCNISIPVIIAEPAQLNLNLVNTATVSCPNASDGAATVSASGGSGAYTYTWMPGALNGNSVANLSAGLYTVSVADANGCNDQINVSISEPAELSGSIASTNDVTCNGAADGSITINASGGTGALTFAWIPVGPNSANLTGLNGGNYTCTVTDANGCAINIQATVNEPTLLVAAIDNVQHISCAGGNDGSILLSVIGGATGYSYNWLPNVSNVNVANGLGAGNYNITVTDANGCTAVLNTSIFEPSPMVANLIANQSTCGLANGSLAANVNGGTGIYTYAWNPALGNLANPTNLSAGNYNLTITDDNGCQLLMNAVVVDAPGALINSITVSDVSCFGQATGSLDALVVGGTAPLSFNWSPNGGSGTTANNLIAGNYTLTVTDGNGCVSTSNAIVTEPLQLNLNIINNSNISCFGGNDGSIITQGNGGTGPYSYDWVPNVSVNNSATGLVSGNYIVTITDANGCQQVVNSFLSQPDALASISTTSNTTCGQSNGSVAIAMNGGMAPYNYSWMPALGNVSNATGLPAANYAVTVTDANGCIHNSNLLVNAESVPLLSLNQITDVSCNGGNDGGITSSISGGVGPFTYLWAPAGGSNSMASNLAAGNYSLTVTDMNGCQSSFNATVNQPLAINLNTSASPADCNGAQTGSANVLASGGTGPYSYLWSNGNITNAISNVTAGNYQVTVTDFNGCVALAQLQVTEPDMLNAMAQTVDVDCHGSATGAIAITASGGTQPYAFSWLPNVSATNLAQNLAVGNYTVSITDLNGCNTVLLQPIAEPSALNVVINTSDVICNGDVNGSVHAIVNGGVGPYNYNWLPGNINMANLANVGAGNYSLQITDANGCNLNANTTINEPALLMANIIQTTNVTCFNGMDGTASIGVTGGTGPYNYNWNPNGGNNANASNLAAGAYSVQVIDANGCLANQNLQIAQPADLTLNTVQVDNASCFGLNDGSIVLTANGGNGGFTYTWLPNVSSQNIANGLNAGNYQAIVTDAFGCSDQLNININEPPAIVLNTITNDATCGATNGSASVTAAGGTGGYSYNWTPGNVVAANMVNVSAGAYQITVVDGNGCSSSNFVNVGNAGAPTVNINQVTNVGCNGGSNGSASVAVSGGNAPYSYQWSPAGGNAAVAAGLVAGNYAVTVTDANGCIEGANLIITEPDPLLISPLLSHVQCNGGNDGAAQALVSGGIAPYDFTWSSGQLTAAASNLVAGNYSVFITDFNGCVANTNVTIQEPSPIQIQLAANHLLCNGASTGTITSLVNGGTGTYQYVWNPGNIISNNLNNATAGNYSLTITDANGCENTANEVLIEPAPINYNTQVVDATCNASNGSVMILPSGGSGGYTVAWQGGFPNGALLNSVVAGNYIFTITDNNNCSVQDVVAVNNAGAPSINVNAVSHVSCAGGSNGSANISVSGGAAPYSYSWIPGGATTSIVNNLSAGNYIVNVTDNNNCISSLNININAPTPLGLTASTTQANCGQQNGSATANVVGGVGPYTYLWMPGNVISPILNNVVAGNYSLQITDANGCQMNGAAIVANAGGGIASIDNFMNPLCNGGNDGSLTAVIAGGTAPFSYAWLPGGGNNAIANQLTAGNYTVTITDAAGCIAAASYTLIDPAPIANTMNVTPSSCGFSNAAVTTQVTGGTAPYFYLWSNGSTQSSLQAINAGNYSVTISDSHGCTLPELVMINNLQGPVVNTLQLQDALCNNTPTGSISVSAASGTAPFNYSWTGMTATTPSITGLYAGTYEVLVSDANGCSTTLSFNIQEPLPLSNVMNATDAHCALPNGGLAATVAGGSAPYNFLWTPGNFNSPSLTSVFAGNYQLQVTDNNGCLFIDQAVVADLPPGSIVVNNIVDVACYSDSTGSIAISLSGGTAPFNYLWSNGATQAAIQNIPSGNYQVTVTDFYGCIVNSLYNISQPPATILSLLATDVSCYGGADGSISATINGGTGPYNYTWSNGSNGSTSIQSLTAGYYSLLVTDDNGCTTTISDTIFQPNAISLNAVVLDATCSGMSNGAITSQASGGTPPFNYSWMPNVSNAPVAQNLASGSYQLTISDANGCQHQQQYQVSVPNPIVASMANPDTICIGQLSMLQPIVTGGVQPYNFNWNTGDTLSTLIVSPSNTSAYSLEIIDANGCTFQLPAVTQQVFPPISLSLNATSTICEGEVATLQAIASGGNGGPYHYNWSNGSTGSSLSLVLIQSTTFIVNATDQCTQNIPQQQATILVNPLPNVNFQPYPANGCVPLSVNFNSNVNTPTGTQYLWDFGNGIVSTDPNPSMQYNTPGVFPVQLSLLSPEGCSNSLAIAQAVEAFPLPDAAFDMDQSSVKIPEANVNFYDRSLLANEWKWDFGDGSPLDYSPFPQHQYQQKGIYTITLFVESNHQCTDFTQLQVRVEEQFQIFIPNTFTPNADGSNEFFTVYGLGFEMLSLDIFDRWGDKIFTTYDINKGWDGVPEGKSNLAPEDVYVYLVKVKDMDGNIHRYNGNVNLVK